MPHTTQLLLLLPLTSSPAPQKATWYGSGIKTCHMEDTIYRYGKGYWSITMDDLRDTRGAFCM